ncbi:prepilin peptidase [bacterium]|nr:prepilin peptidase [Akkermansiaceae bacterium]MDB4577370.1 prepilin peptidase [bacterium]
MLQIWQSDVMAVGILFIGLCVGSFLTVAIYRIPRGLSVNEPKRSFCPHCKTQLPAWQNIPVITWLIQMGKCRSCKAPIAVRYLIVEVLTGALYFVCWKFFPMTAAILAIIFLTILVTISFIDAEHQVIPIQWTTAGSILAILGAWFASDLLKSDSGESGGILDAALGWLAGFLALWAVIHLGKWLFGRKKHRFEKAESWEISEGYKDDPQVHFVLGDEAYSWDELFFRDSDELLIIGHSFKVDGQRTPGKKLILQRESFTIGDEKWEIGKLKSLSGKTTEVTIPREAMGDGDPHLLGMIGAFLGWPAIPFVILASSLYGIIAGIITRVGFGKPLPFGPFLALGAATWLFGGWKLWQQYFDLLQVGL